MANQTMKNRIICAANRHKTTHDILLGIRHWDTFMQCERKHLLDPGKNADWEQGFIDRMGYFHHRTEAWKIAVEAGQIIRRCGGDEADGGTLYSENLY